MDSLLNNCPRLNIFLFVVGTIGDFFLQTLQLTSVIKRFVFEDCTSTDDSNEDREVLSFSAECKSLLYLYPSLLRSEKDRFAAFHDYTLLCGRPMAAVLISSRNNCRECGKQLFVENQLHPIVIYSNHRGTFLGSRVSKLCRHCKIHEHYGYYTKESKKCYDRDVLLMDYLQSTEDTAFDLNLLKDCSNLLVVGAVPFSTYATSYNRRFHHTKTANAEIKGPQVKRTKRSVR